MRLADIHAKSTVTNAYNATIFASNVYDFYSAFAGGIPNLTEASILGVNDLFDYWLSEQN